MSAFEDENMHEEIWDLEAKVARLRAERDSLRAVVAALETWTHQMGPHLVPMAPSTDTYGDGMRRAKHEVKTILCAVLGKEE